MQCSALVCIHQFTFSPTFALTLSNSSTALVMLFPDRNAVYIAGRERAEDDRCCELRGPRELSSDDYSPSRQPLPICEDLSESRRQS